MNRVELNLPTRAAGVCHSVALAFIKAPILARASDHRTQEQLHQLPNDRYVRPNDTRCFVMVPRHIAMPVDWSWCPRDRTVPPPVLVRHQSSRLMIHSNASSMRRYRTLFVMVATCSSSRSTVGSPYTRTNVYYLVDICSYRDLSLSLSHRVTYIKYIITNRSIHHGT